MSPLMALLVAALAGDEVRILALRAEAVEKRASLTMLFTSSPLGVTVSREGSEVVVSLPAEAPQGLVLPEVVPPMEGVRLERASGRVMVKVRVAPSVLYEVERQGSVIRVVFGEGPSQLAGEVPRSDVESLYKSLFPPPAGESTEVKAPETKASDDGRGGLIFGPLRLRPSVTAAYVDADTTLLATPQVVHDRYYQVVPSVRGDMPLGTGSLNLQYEARWRGGSAFGVVDTTSHFLTASLEMPWTANLTVRASDHFSRGVLEAGEVDPGNEYFFNLGLFTRNEARLGTRVETGGRIDLDVVGSVNTVHVAPGSGFFSFETQSLTAGLGLELGPTLRAALEYTYQRVPTPQGRPEAESRANSVGLDLKGDILPLLAGQILLGYQDQQNPRAAAGGTQFRGFVASVSLVRDFAPGTSLTISGGRSTDLSAFEGNGYYIASHGTAAIAFPLPFLIEAHGGVGYQQNDYRTAVTGSTASRQDRIFGWSAGLGRPITSWAYARVDYRHDRRTSDLHFFNNATHALTVQVGMGLFEKTPTPR